MKPALSVLFAYHVGYVLAGFLPISGVRNVILALGSSCVIPSIERWGVLATNSVATGVMTLGAL